tara:strand:+ start:3091 stop:3333 length:243 start_codon:yes stop_codon:yes gene_type:complete
MSAFEIMQVIKKRKGKIRTALTSVRIGCIASRTKGVERRKNNDIYEYRVYMENGVSGEYDEPSAENENEQIGGPTKGHEA